MTGFLDGRQGTESAMGASQGRHGWDGNPKCSCWVL